MLHRNDLAEVTFGTAMDFPLLSISSYWMHSLFLLLLFQVFTCFFFFFFPFRFSLFSLHPEFLSPLRVISHFVSFLVSLCGPYCSVSGMKSLSLPSVLCSGSWLHYPHLTSSFFSRRSNMAYWPFSLCWRCAGFFPTPKLTLASQDSYRRLSP